MNQRPQGLQVSKAMTGFLQYKLAEGLSRRVQKPYSAGFEVGIVGLSRIIGLKCGWWRLPGRSGVFGNIDLAREMVDWINTLRGCEDTSKRIE